MESGVKLFKRGILEHIKALVTVISNPSSVAVAVDNWDSSLHGGKSLVFFRFQAKLSFSLTDYIFNLAEPASPKKRPLEETEKEEPAPKQLKTENGDGNQ